jgi:hypothetical protein
MGKKILILGILWLMFLLQTNIAAAAEICPKGKVHPTYPLGSPGKVGTFTQFCVTPCNNEGGVQGEGNMPAAFISYVNKSCIINCLMMYGDYCPNCSNNDGKACVVQGYRDAIYVGKCISNTDAGIKANGSTACAY